MQELEIFKNEEFGEVRTVMIDDKPYFVANDIASALGYKRPADAVSAHCKGSVKYRYLTNGGQQEVKIIPEGDVYRLIIKSKLPNAQKFESWVMDEVLPTIRKHGGYINNDEGVPCFRRVLVIWSRETRHPLTGDFSAVIWL